MPRQVAMGLAFVLAATLSVAPAQAIIQGTSSSLGAYTVRLIGDGNCTGVVIARRAVVTAAHCARGMRVMADGGTVRVTGVARSAVLDDGRRVSVSGDAAILTLAAPLSGVGAAFVPLRVDHAARADGSVSTSAKAVSPATVPAYGLVAMPNGDLANEAVQQIMASVS